MKKIIVDGKEISIKEASSWSTESGVIIARAKKLGYFEPEVLKIAKDVCDEEFDPFYGILETPEYDERLLKIYLEHTDTDLVLDSAMVNREYGKFCEQRDAERAKVAEERARESEALIDTLP